MKRNYWPLFFIGIFSFVFSMIIWTIMSASKVPVIEDHSFMKKYQDVDENYNKMMDSNALFLSKYNFELSINDKIFGLTTDDIKLAQRVVEKYSQHKNILKVGQNNLNCICFDKNITHTSIYNEIACYNPIIRLFYFKRRIIIIQYHITISRNRF